MIFQLRKTCLQSLERLLHRLTHLHSTHSGEFSQQVLNKLQSIQVEAEAVKNSLTVMAARLVGMEGQLGMRKEGREGGRSDGEERHRQMEGRLARQEKEISFVKYSLKSAKQELMKQQQHNLHLRQSLLKIRQHVVHNGASLQAHIDQLLHQNTPNNKENNDRGNKPPLPEAELESISDFSMEKPPIVSAITQSCNLNLDLAKLSRGQAGEGRGNGSGGGIRQYASTERVTQRGSEGERDKRSELARLVEQQDRVLGVKDRYLFTNFT